MHVDMHEQDLVPFIPTPFLSILFISISGRKRTGFAHNKLKLQSGRPLSASPICDVACLWCHYSIGKSQVHMPSRITASRSDAWSVSSTMWIVDTAMKEGRMCSIRQALTIGYSQASLIDITLHIISLEISKSKKKSHALSTDFLHQMTANKMSYTMTYMYMYMPYTRMHDGITQIQRCRKNSYSDKQHRINLWWK